MGFYSSVLNDDIFDNTSGLDGFYGSCQNLIPDAFATLFHDITRNYETEKQDNTISLDVNEEAYIQAYIQAYSLGSNIDQPIASIKFEWRK